MRKTIELVPTPQVVLERIAENRREHHLLRSLLKVAIYAAEERDLVSEPTPPPDAADARGVA